MYRIDNRVGKIRIIGNMLSDNCLLATVKRDRSWRGVDYSALDEHDRSIWEERWPTSFLLKERQNAIDSGRYEEWMYERMNRPVAAKSRKLVYKVVDMTFERRFNQNTLRINQMEPIVVTTWLGIDPEIDAEDWGPRAFVTLAKGYFPVEPGRLRPCIFVLDYLWRPLDPSDIVRGKSCSNAQSRTIWPPLNSTTNIHFASSPSRANGSPRSAAYSVYKCLARPVNFSSALT